MKKVTLLALFLASSLIAKAGELKLSKKGLTSDQYVSLSQFVAEANELIPEKIKETVKHDITVEFQNFKKNKDIKTLPANRCTESIDIKYAAMSRFNKKKIKVSKLFIPEILKGELGSTSFPCGHGNYYRKALATVLHEVAHVYDYQKIRTKSQRDAYNSCRDGNRTRPGAKCRAAVREYRNKLTISGLNSFFNLANWKRTLFSKKDKNEYDERKTDAYESVNLGEHYAVNFEYFIMDKEFKCRRPTYYKYYAKAFDHNAYDNFECKVNTLIRLDDKKVVRDIDPSRVYRVDYLLASKGDSLISGFGHSMYRLVVCAPFRKEVSKECLKDSLFHVVLSYRANIDDIKSSTWKGVTGGYDSLLFMLSWPKVIEEYNLGELRDLYSMPMELNKDQKRDFIHKVLENYWEYRGSYKFISQNCASESLDLLQAALPEHEITYGDVIKPYSLFNKLIKTELSKDDLYENREAAMAEGMLFESDAEKIAMVKEKLFGEEESDFRTYRVRRGNGTFIKKRKKDILDILKEFDASRLNDKYERIKALDKTPEKVLLLKGMAIFTNALLNAKRKDIDDKIGSYLESKEKEDSELGEKVRAWNDSRKETRVTSNDNGYGIPLEITDEEFEEYKERTLAQNAMEVELCEMVKDEFQTEIDDLLEIQQLLKNTRLELTMTQIYVR